MKKNFNYTWLYILTKRLSILIFIGIAILATLVKMYIGQRQEEVLQIYRNKLEGISLLKERSIFSWALELNNDAAHIVNRTHLNTLIDEYVKKGSEESRYALSEKLNQILPLHEFRELIIADASGCVVASSNHKTSALYYRELESLKLIANKDHLYTFFYNITDSSNTTDLVIFSYILKVEREYEDRNLYYIFRKRACSELYSIIGDSLSLIESVVSYLYIRNGDSVINLKSTSSSPYYKIYTAPESSLSLLEESAGITSVKKIGETGWYLSSYIEKRDVLKSFYSNLFQTIATLGIYLILIFFSISYFYYFRQRGILKELLKKQREVEKQRSVISDSKKRYSDLFENDLTGDYICTLDGTIEDCNKKFLELLGFQKKKEVLGKSILEFYANPQLRGGVVDMLLEQKTLTDFEIELKNRKGKILLCVENVVGRFGPNGNLIDYFGYLYDITEKRQKDKDLEFMVRMNEVLRETASGYINIPIGKTASFIINSLEIIGRFIGADRVYIFEYNWKENTCSNTYEWCETGIESQIENLQSVPLADIPQWWTPHKRGEVLIIDNINSLDLSDVVRQILEPQNVISLITFPIMIDNHCVGFVGLDYVRESHSIRPAEKELIRVFAQVLGNIQTRISLENELINAKERAEESDKLKTAFLNNISHEIRTPLNGILGFGQIITEAELSKEERSLAFQNVKNASDRLLNTVTDYIDMAGIFSQTIAVRNTKFNILQFFCEATQMYKGLCLDKGIDFKIVTPQYSENETITTDRDLLLKVIHKIADNAVKFTSEGEISFGYNIYTKDIEFFVKDSGVGIEPFKLSQIYKMFAQGDTSNSRSYEGSGLGLSIARGFTDLLGGKIDVKLNSLSGEKGTTFTISLPKT